MEIFKRNIDNVVLLILPLTSLVLIFLDSLSGADKFSFYGLFLTLCVMIGFFLLYMIEDFHYKIFILIFLVPLVFFSSIPQLFLTNNDVPQYFILLSVYLIAMAYEIRIGKVLLNETRFDSFEKINFTVFLIFLFVSIWLVNIKDILYLEGFLKISLMLVSIYVSGYSIPKALLKKGDLLISVLKLIFYIGLVSSIIGVLTYFSIITYSVRYAGTTLSFFRNPNNTPFLYTFSIPCGLYLIFYRKEMLNQIERMSFAFIIAFMILSVLFTYSRAGILAIATVLAVFTFFRSKKIFAVTSLVFVSIAGMVFKNFLAAKGAASAFSRASLIAAALEMLGSSRTGLLFGFGAYSARKRYKLVLDSFNIIQENVDFPHNFILFFIMEFGLIALIILIIYLFIIIYKSIRNISRFKNSYYSNILVLSLSVILGCFAQGLLEDMILFPQYFVFHLALIFLGVIVLVNKELKQHNTAAE